MKNQALSGGVAARERLVQSVAMVLALVTGGIAVVLRVVLLPTVIWRFCIVFGIGALRTVAKIVFGLFCIALLGNLLYAMTYVLAYPWLR
ncbi:hypothetical protein [Duganella sp. BuS-21]|uniref:hypothetical protein n=1 Tax=Duganella sp. BuS-21 TaxID=2943848 RepID=UPI0035A71A09